MNLDAISQTLLSLLPLVTLALVVIAARRRWDGEDQFVGIGVGVMAWVLVSLAWFLILPIAAFVGLCMLTYNLAKPRPQKLVPADPAQCFAEQEVERLLHNS